MLHNTRVWYVTLFGLATITDIRITPRALAAIRSREKYFDNAQCKNISTSPYGDLFAQRERTIFRDRDD